jgi:hypothetical protein
MSNVQSIRGAITHERKPVNATIQAAEDLLEQCRSGEVRGFAVACAHFNGLASTTIVGTADSYAVQGALVQIQHKIARVIEDH